MFKSVMITGANAGIGKETAKQLALSKGVERIYLACRNKVKAEVAVRELETATGKSIFKILIMYTSDITSVRSAVANLTHPVEGLIMNAGGAGGEAFNQLTQDGVMQQFAVNVLGHAVLAQELIDAGKLTKTAVYAGSEAARGVKEMGMKSPEFKNSSVEEFASIMDGSFFANMTDSQIPYGSVKYLGAMWMSSMSRRYPNIKFVTMSPGGTKGTNALDSLPIFKKLMFKAMLNIMSWSGKVHTVEIAAKRFIDALMDHTYKSGVFYGSKTGISGEIIDQSSLFPSLNNEIHQDNAFKAIQKFIK